MESALVWHNLSETALDFGLDENGHVSKKHIRPVWEGLVKPSLKWPSLSEELILSALKAFGMLL
jgi:hypothetical protein